MDPQLPNPQQPQTLPPAPDPSFIAPVANPKKARALSQKMVIILVGCILALVAGVSLLFLSRANDPADDITRLQAMMQSVSDIIAEGRKSAKNPNVVKATSDASILVSGDLSTLKTVFSSAAANKEITTSEKTANTKVLADLKSAAVDARFDSEYITALSDKLTSTRAQLSKVYDKTSKPAYRAATKSVYDHFTSLLDSLSKITL